MATRQGVCCCFLCTSVSSEQHHLLQSHQALSCCVLTDTWETNPTPHHSPPHPISCRRSQTCPNSCQNLSEKQRKLASCSFLLRLSHPIIIVYGTRQETQFREALHSILGPPQTSYFSFGCFCFLFSN